MAEATHSAESHPQPEPQESTDEPLRRLAEDLGRLLGRALAELEKRGKEGRREPDSRGGPPVS
jgi:hypothetical protein